MAKQPCLLQEVHRFSDKLPVVAGADVAGVGGGGGGWGVDRGGQVGVVGGGTVLVAHPPVPGEGVRLHTELLW